MLSNGSFLTFWFGVLNMAAGLTRLNFTLFRTINSSKYASLLVTPLDVISQIECSLQCEHTQCCAASYHQPLQQCYLHQSCFGDVENATGWNLLKKEIALKTIYVNQEKSWNDSQAHCASLGGRLAVIDTVEKHDLMMSYETNSAWLGATDRDEEGTWVWHNPTQPVMLDYWRPKQPDNNRDGEHCMAYNNVHKWDDRPCSYLYEFICDIPEKY